MNERMSNFQPSYFRLIAKLLEETYLASKAR